MNRTTDNRTTTPDIDMLANGYPNIVTLRTTRARPAKVAVNTEEIDSQVKRFPSRYPRKKRSIVALIVMGGLVILVCALIWTQLVTPVWTSFQNQWHYGDSKITEMNANVGHGGMSHFVAEYYDGAIVVIEIPVNNPNSTQIYALPGLTGGSTSTVILLSTEPGKVTGKPDLVIQVQGSPFATILYNTGTTFKKSEE